MQQITDLLLYIDPAKLNYQEWVNVGMALKNEGCTWTVWDQWSRSDRRYRDGECEKKWESFNGATEPVTAGTIYHYAVEQGYRPVDNGSAIFEWDDTICTEEDRIIDRDKLEIKTLSEPEEWHPGKEVITYLETLFDVNDIVGYVTKSFMRTDGDKVKYSPTEGSYTKTAGELIAELNKYGDDIGAVLGDYDPQAGAWIRFNPVDGKGVKNINVTEFKYALIESDSVTLEEQNTILRDLELPIAILVYSGGKSLHAIVKVDAADSREYRKRVEYLYGVCTKNGFKIDTQNKNPSRLSRLPGVMRNGRKQYIVDRNIGKGSFDEWREWIESINDDLPDTENLATEWGNLPELSPPLIEGILRQGHKMLIAGPSKAGKSFALIELCIAIAEGAKWLGFGCSKGRVMYVNLELDRASCLHRFKDVYTALNIPPQNLDNIDIWNLRGKSLPMDKLAPKLIRRAQKKKYAAVIIDPIYKIITGDENSADQMAHFCNQFDKVCTEVGCAVIYCHHHSKGTQSGKRSMDRASGSGVFARDPDAMLDISELFVTEAVKKTEENTLVCDICLDWITRFCPDFRNNASQDDMQSAAKMREHAHTLLKAQSYELMCRQIDSDTKILSKRTAWRIEGILREFEPFDPVNCWFRYPIHSIDSKGTLKDLMIEDVKPYTKNLSQYKQSPEERKQERMNDIETAFNTIGGDADGRCEIKELAGYLGVTEKTIVNRLKEHPSFYVKNGMCFSK